MPKTFISIVLFFTLFITTNAFAGVVIIVNKNNPIINISSSELKHMYTGELKLWDNGKKISPVVLKDSNIEVYAEYADFPGYDIASQPAAIIPLGKLPPGKYAVSLFVDSKLRKKIEFKVSH